MTYYLNIRNNNIDGGSQLDNSRFATDTEFQVEVTENIYNEYLADNLKYIWNGTEIVINPNYEADKQAKERQELDQLTLTPADVERALYKAKGMDFEDLKGFIATNVPSIDIKALAIEFRAKDFYRGATLSDGTRLIDIVGALLGYTSADMDYLFLNKELPIKEEL